MSAPLKRNKPDSSAASIREGDFNSLEARITFRNRTSDYTIAEGKYQIPRELLEKGLAFDVPRKACALGHVLNLELTIVGADKKTKLVAAGRVTEIELIDDETQTVYVEFFQVSEDDWKEIKVLYASKQRETLRLLKSMRGF